jgi:FkbM family methyltransferase
MSFLEKFNFWILRLSRSFYYNIRYRLNKWTTIEGILFPVYLRYGYGVLRFIDNGEYESGEIAIISKTLEDGDKVLEMGTGLGFISAYCAKKIGSQNVYTFEANPSLERNIRELYDKNGVRPCLTFAILGKEEGKVLFYKDRRSMLASSLQSSPEPELQPVEVPVKKLADVIRDIQPTYLVMDIEGGEYEIFEAIEFQTIKKIQVELHPDVLGPEKVSRIFRKLTEFNFVRDTSLVSRDNYYFYKKPDAVNQLSFG